MSPALEHWLLSKQVSFPSYFIMLTHTTPGPTATSQDQTPLILTVQSVGKTALTCDLYLQLIQDTVSRPQEADPVPLRLQPCAALLRLCGFICTSTCTGFRDIWVFLIMCFLCKWRLADKNTRYSLILDNQMTFTRKNVFHIYSPLPVGEIWAHMDGFYCPKQWFLCLLLAQHFVAHVVGT